MKLSEISEKAVYRPILGFSVRLTNGTSAPQPADYSISLPTNQRLAPTVCKPREMLLSWENIDVVLSETVLWQARKPDFRTN